MITSILIANRAEIALRIIGTCHELGIEAVAVFTEVDRALPFVAAAARALLIDDYLSIESVVAAATRAGAQAIHPGYGFLAENAAFAKAVIDAGLIWIGPPPDAIDAMGDKAAARRLAAEHDVPIVPGYDGPDTLGGAAEVGYPLLVKAVAGGGGRGMRRVDAEADLADAVESARREAESAFGNGAVILERLVERPRHVEVQILADKHGNVVHLFERECSIQRRHQKIIEEAPSPAVDDALREALGDAACRIAAAAGYEGAGTAEFLLDLAGDFYFLEMNTRLQVEHPVTEAITGLDLVAEQIAIAEGRPLEVFSRLMGHAIEARLYAEDPNRDYLPATGTLLRLDLDVPGVRIDGGYAAGDVVGASYDPMIAKIIAWGPDRPSATRRMLRAVQQAWVPGVITNLPLLREIFAHPAWQEGDLHTGFLGQHELPSPPPLNLADGAVGAVVVGWWQRRGSFGAGVPLGWRMHGRATQHDSFVCGAVEVDVSWRTEADAVRVYVAVDGQSDVTERLVRVQAVEGDAWTLDIDGVVATWRIAVDGALTYVHTGRGEAFLQRKPRLPAPSGAADEPGTLTAQTPGKVVAVNVAPGDSVSAGQTLLVLEAMKMEHPVVAPEDGVIAQVRVDVGETVDEGALLVRFEEPDVE